jgi:hypothetical protein
LAFLQIATLAIYVPSIVKWFVRAALSSILADAQDASIVAQDVAPVSAASRSAPKLNNAVSIGSELTSLRRQRFAL